MERPTKKYLLRENRTALYNFLLCHSEAGKLPMHLITHAATKFGVSRQTVERLWKRATTSTARGAVIPDTSLRFQGRKEKMRNLERVQTVPIEARTTIRSIASSSEVPKSTVHRYFKKGILRRHTNSVKPFLTDKQRLARLEFCLSMLRPTIGDDLQFVDMYNTVHIDEKWFYITKATKNYYLYRDESVPYRSAKSKRYLIKVMFLACTARPRFDSQGTLIFDGKVGLFPFIERIPAKRNSKYRPAGTLVTKSVNVTKNVTRKVFIEKLLPAIKSLDVFRGQLVLIQQDNAKPHISVSDPEFVQAAKEGGWDIRLVCQPANSPDLNILDLGFFRAIQSLQQQITCNNIDDLVSAGENSFLAYPAEKVNKNFLTLQSVMLEIIKCEGNNSYKFPHLKKDMLIRRGDLPENLTCSSQAFSAAKAVVAREKAKMANHAALNDLILWEFREWESSLEITEDPRTPPRSEQDGDVQDEEEEDVDEWDCVN
jgi:hypothetical protein